MDIVYLNGRYLPRNEATVSVDDRGFLLGDGIYEATPAYGGRPFLLERHLARMGRGLEALGIGFDPAALAPVHGELLERNGLRSSPFAYVYVQVTRGVAPRSHAFPVPPPPPTVYAFAAAASRPERARWEQGFEAITVPDRRWSRVDIKTISLVANVLAQQSAAEAGASDAIFVRDGMAMEGAHNNLFVVRRGVLMTAPESNYILHGVTRAFVLELARELGIPVREQPVPVEWLADADEIFFSGTTTEIRPAVRVDGRPVGTGEVGAVARRLYDAFLERTARVAGESSGGG